MGALNGFLTLLCFVQGAISLNILIFLIGTNHFERGTFEFLAQQLALRNHEVVTVKPILIPEEPRLVKPKLHLVREKTLKNLLSKKFYEPLEQAGDVEPWTSNYEYEKYEHPYWAAHNASCLKMLNSNLMDQLKKDNLDVIIAYAGNPCQLAIARVLGKPVIYFDQEGLTDETLVAAGVPPNLDYPSSHCNLPQLQFGYLNRIANGICLLKEYIAQSGIGPLASVLSHRYKKLDLPISRMFADDYEIKKRFKSFPDVNELKSQSAVFFANTDRLLEYERALPPHVIPVGGMHIDHPKPLFAPWNSSIESAEEGLIIVTMGTQANSAKMPIKMAKALFGALSKLTKYRIYWRVGPNIQLQGVNVENPPPHINFTAYIPQNDLLAHQRCKLLVTNGGMLSVMEALAHGVPIVGIPLYGVNRHNLGKVANKGLGVVLDKNEITDASLYHAMTTVLESPKYKKTAKEMSREFKARKSSPFNEALHWIEWVGRQGGNPHFRPEPQPFQLLRFLCVDLMLVIVLMFYLPFAILRWCCRRSSSSRESTSQPNRQNGNSKTNKEKKNQ